MFPMHRTRVILGVPESVCSVNYKIDELGRIGPPEAVDVNLELRFIVVL